jgi:hypothetical protein
MDIQTLERILNLHTYIGILDGMVERLDGELTTSEKALIDEWKQQYTHARGVLIQQSGVTIPEEKLQQELTVKELPKEPQLQKDQKKEQPAKKPQKPQLVQPLKQDPEYPE